MLTRGELERINEDLIVENRQLKEHLNLLSERYEKLCAYLKEVSDYMSEKEAEDDE